MHSLQRKFFAIDEYLLLEENAKIKHELVDGEIYVMAGAKENHVKIVTNIVGNFFNQLKNSLCDVYSTDMKLKAGTDCYYPDVFVKCDPSDDGELVKEKPILIVEVLSDSTEVFDKTKKLQNYLNISTLLEYLLVSQNKIEVWVYRRVGTKWEMEILKDDDKLHLVSIDLKISIKEFYVKVLC